MEFTHFTRAERNNIYEGKCNKWSLGKIAANLGRARSSISREMCRNSDRAGYLYPHQADELARGRRQNKYGLKIDRDVALKNFVIKKLHERLSPEMIAGLWKKENPGKNICAETIYDWVYTSPDGKRLRLDKLLVRAKTKRGMKQKLKQPKIKNAVSIDDRPDEINKREELGHYECDLIFNKGSMSKNILTMTERVTRETIMIRNESKHTSVVMGALIKYIQDKMLVVKSITFDNGSEFASHTKLNDLGTKTYFCHPGHPWEKGSIEHVNGVSRRFLPFEMLADTITPELVNEVMAKVNNLPRKILGYMTPPEFARSLNQEVLC